MQIGQSKYSRGGTVRLAGHYGDGTPALVVVGHDGQREATLTVRLAEPAAYPCLWLKGWAENEGLIEAAVEAGIVALTGRTAAAGFVEAVEARLTAEAEAELIPDDSPWLLCGLYETDSDAADA